MTELCSGYLSGRCNWLYVLIMSETRFRVNLHSTQQAFVALEDVLKSFWRRLANTSWRRLGRRKIVALKMSWRHILKTSGRHVLKTSWRQTKCLLGISLSNKSKSVSDKSISHISISDKSRRIQNPLIRTQQFQYSSYLETQAFLFWELKLKYLTTVSLLWNQVNSNSTFQNRWGNKNEVLSNMLDKYI